MASSWVVSAASERVALSGQGTTEVSFTVTNGGPVHDRVVFEPVLSEGASREWVTVDEPQRPVPPGASVTYLVKLAVPAGTAAGSYWLQGRAYSADTAPEESSVLSGRVAFDVAAPEQKKRRWWLWAIPAAVLVLVVAGVLFFLLRDSGEVARGPVDLIELAPEATWRSGAGELPFPGTLENVDDGLVLVDEFTHENGTVDRVLYTHPQLVQRGFVEGDFPLPRAIADSDRFAARVGFVQGSKKGAATFVVLAVEGSNVVELGRARDNSDDGRLINLDVDLSRAEGATMLRLRVVDDGGSGAEWATTWLQPRIVG